MKRTATTWFLEIGRNFRALLEVYTRRSKAWPLFKYGFALVAVSLGGSALFSVELATEIGSFSYIHDPSNPTWAPIPQTAYIVGLAMIAIGIFILIYELIRDHRLDQRRLLLVVEQRGLNGLNLSPLKEALPRSRLGLRDTRLVGQAEFSAEGGCVFAPEHALAKIEGLRRELESARADRAPEDVTVVYGGVASVPFAALAGALIRNFCKVDLWDWERHAGRWQELDAVDDGAPIHVGSMPRGAEEVVLAISASYACDHKAVEITFPGLPIIEIAAANVLEGNHWSADWQARMKKAFLKALQDLGRAGVSRIYLVAAVPNSLAFGLGQTYDPRLHPELFVCQYERSVSPPYPWALRLPTAGDGKPKIVYRGQPEKANEAA
jgi:hypothetical protein